jgi:hypothetical protein
MISDKPKKAITCIVPRGRALPVSKALRDNYNIITINTTHARGSGRMTPLAWRGLGESTEKDIMTVIVDESVSEEIFSYIYTTAGIDQPHGGIVFQFSLAKTTEYELPDLPFEED